MTTIPDRRLGWRQRLHLRCAERRRESLRRLDDLRDTQHVQIQAPVTEGYVDLITRTIPSLRLVIYGMLV
jgi:hypothetical protein